MDSRDKRARDGIAPRGSACRKGGIAGWSMVEVVFMVFISSIVVVMFSALYSTWGKIRTKTSVSTALQMEGRVTVEKVLRRIREEMVGLLTVRYEEVGKFKEALVIMADTDADGVEDAIRGWGVRPLDKDRDGQQDEVDADRDGIPETKLWTLVELFSPTTNWPVASWRIVAICESITGDWTTEDGKHTYRPFDYTGKDVNLDYGNDGIPATSDEGEMDGLISEVELGNYVTINQSIDADIAAEVDNITSIGMGLKLMKKGGIADVESIVVYQGMVKPRNWNK